MDKYVKKSVIILSFMFFFRQGLIYSSKLINFSLPPAFVETSFTVVVYRKKGIIKFLSYKNIYLLYINLHC